MRSNPPWQSGAVHGVELHAIFKVLIAGRQGICDVGSVTLHGSVDGPLGDAMLEARWGDVCVGGDEAEHGEAEPAKNQYEKSDDYAENEFPMVPPDELLWQMEWVGR